MSRKHKAQDSFVSYDDIVNQYGSYQSSGNDTRQASNAYGDSVTPPLSASPSTYRNDSHHQQTRKNPPKKHKHIGLIVTIIILAILGIACGCAYAWYNSISDQLNDSNVISSDLEAELKQTSITSEPFYMLLLGTDGRPGETTYRSDTIMLARIDPVNKQMTLVSIPRDTMVTINGERQKINAAHSIGGAAGIVKAVSSLCGVEISHYAEVSFDGMQQLVDAVGGVDIDVEDDIYDPEHFGDMRLYKGYQHLDGNYAMFYARSRHFTDGDYARTRHQRNLVKTLAQQILSSTDATTIIPLVNTLAGMITTDMSVSDIVTLANTMRGMDTDSIYTCTIPSVTKDVDGISYVVADLDGLKSLMDKVDSGEDPDGPETMSEGLSTSVTNVQNSANNIGSSSSSSSSSKNTNTSKNTSSSSHSSSKSTNTSSNTKTSKK